LKAGLVRAVGVPAERFAEDYLRILRALRFSARFDFVIDEKTWTAARDAASGLRRLSAERVRDEWFKGLETAGSVLRLASLWREVGAADVWIPELNSGPLAAGSVREPPASVRDPVLLTVLLTSSPAAVLRRLKASNAEIERAAAMERGPEAPEDVSEISVRRWLARVGHSAADLISLWGLRRGSPPEWSQLAEEIRRRRDPLTRSDLAVTGNDLQSLGARGPAVGRVLGELLEMVLQDPSLNRKETLLDRARGLLA